LRINLDTIALIAEVKRQLLTSWSSHRSSDWHRVLNEPQREHV